MKMKEEVSEDTKLIILKQITKEKNMWNSY